MARDSVDLEDGVPERASEADHRLLVHRLYPNLSGTGASLTAPFVDATGRKPLLKPERSRPSVHDVGNGCLDCGRTVTALHGRDDGEVLPHHRNHKILVKARLVLANEADLDPVHSIGFRYDVVVEIVDNRFVEFLINPLSIGDEFLR